MISNDDPNNQDDNRRVYFGDKTDWQEDARDLMRAVFYEPLEQENPEPLVRVFGLLAVTTDDPKTRDALSFLIAECFDRSIAHSEEVKRFRERCIGSPTAWESAEANPRRINDEREQASPTDSVYASTHDDDSQDVVNTLPHQAETSGLSPEAKYRRWAEALLEIIDSEELPDEIVGAAHRLFSNIRKRSLDRALDETETHIRLFIDGCRLLGQQEKAE